MLKKRYLTEKVLTALYWSGFAEPYYSVRDIVHSLYSITLLFIREEFCTSTFGKQIFGLYIYIYRYSH